MPTFIGTFWWIRGISKVVVVGTSERGVGEANLAKAGHGAGGGGAGKRK